MTPVNLFADVPSPLADEQFETLVAHSAFRLERIVSTGHATPVGEWLSQSRAEWVAVLAGSAAVRFEGAVQARELRPGDWLYIAGNRRHRVEWTDAERPTVWLALHFDGAEATP